MADGLMRRSLASADHGAMRILDAIRWPTPFGSGFRLYFARGSDLSGLQLNDDAKASLSEVVSVAKNSVVDGETSDTGGALQLDLANGRLNLKVSKPETELFDNLNVLLGIRHHETPDHVAQWLEFHVAVHGASGLVLLDRSKPGDTRDVFAKDLAKAVRKLPQLQRAVLVTADIPLGRDDHPAFGDPARARNANDRNFSPDPWLAALNEPVMFDALKMRFLTRAGAVIALDPTDYLQVPEDGISVFSTCRHSHTGFMPVVGQYIFPWRVRKDRSPSVADHICRHIPPMSAPNRWCVSPRRLGAEQFWLPNTITGAVGLADEVAHYDRAMSLIYQSAEVATLANKEALDLDTTLLDRAHQVFNAKPVLPPKKKPIVTKIREQTPSGRTVIVTCMKNEGPFILEWIAYHRMIGVDDFLVFTNDCDDGTVEILDRMQQMGIVQRRENPFRETGGKPQQSALAAAKEEPVIQDAGWIISMDVDEFINIHVGQGMLQDLYSEIAQANMISLTWRLFGNADIVEYRDAPVTQQFTLCAPQMTRRPHQAWGFKTLFQNVAMWEDIGVHRPRGHLGGAIWVNGSGKPMPERLLRTGWRSDVETIGYDLVTLNHYALRSAESFLVKRDRGRVNHVSREQGEAYWFRMNNNGERDLSIQRHAQNLELAIKDLKSDPELFRLHDSSVTAHKEKIERLRQTPDSSALFEKLTSVRMQKLSRLHRHLGMNVFLRGPSVIPDNLLDPDLPPNTFFNTTPPEGRAAD